MTWHPLPTLTKKYQVMSTKKYLIESSTGKTNPVLRTVLGYSTAARMKHNTSYFVLRSTVIITKRFFLCVFFTHRVAVLSLISGHGVAARDRKVPHEDDAVVAHVHQGFRGWGQRAPRLEKMEEAGGRKATN